MTQSNVDISNVDLSKLDRGDKTMEELEELMPQAGLDLVDSMEAQTIAAYEEGQVKAKRKSRHFYRRNRKAWDRMNRKAKLDKMELGVQRTMNLVMGKGFLTDAQLPKLPKEEDTGNT